MEQGFKDYKMAVADELCPCRVAFEDAVKRKENGEINQFTLVYEYFYPAKLEMIAHYRACQSNNPWSAVHCESYMDELIIKN